MKWNDRKSTSSKASASARSETVAAGRERRSASPCGPGARPGSGARRGRNARCPVAPRRMSSTSGVSDEVGVAVSRGQRGEHQLARRDRHARDLDVGRGDPRNRRCARSTASAAVPRPRVRRHRGRRAPRRVDRGGAAAPACPSPSMFDVVSWPGEQQQSGDTDQFVVGEFVAVFAHQHAEQVVTRAAAGGRHQRLHVLAALPLQCSRSGMAIDRSSCRALRCWKSVRSA